MEPPGLDVDPELANRTARPFAPPVLATSLDSFLQPCTRTPKILDPSLCSQMAELDFNNYLMAQNQMAVSHRSKNPAQRPVNRYPYNEPYRYDGSYLRRQRRRQVLPSYEYIGAKDIMPSDEDAELFLEDIASPVNSAVMKQISEQNIVDDPMFAQGAHQTGKLEFAANRLGDQLHRDYNVVDDSQCPGDSSQESSSSDSSSSVGHDRSSSSQSRTRSSFSCKSARSELELSGQFVAGRTFEESRYLDDLRRRTCSVHDGSRHPCNQCEPPHPHLHMGTPRYTCDSPAHNAGTMARASPAIVSKGARDNKDANNAPDTLPTYEEAVNSPLRISLNKSAYKKGGYTGKCVYIAAYNELVCFVTIKGFN